MTEAVIVSTARTPLTKSWKGAFNMTHPASLVYPELNGLRVFERIADRGALDAFASRHQPTWRTPAWQPWLNAAALLALAGCLGVLVRGSRRREWSRG